MERTPVNGENVEGIPSASKGESAQVVRRAGGASFTGKGPTRSTGDRFVSPRTPPLGRTERPYGGRPTLSIHTGPSYTKDAQPDRRSPSPLYLPVYTARIDQGVEARPTVECGVATLRWSIASRLLVLNLRRRPKTKPTFTNRRSAARGSAPSWRLRAPSLDRWKHPVGTKRGDEPEQTRFGRPPSADGRAFCSRSFLNRLFFSRHLP